jgi:hypothetical protein
MDLTRQITFLEAVAQARKEFLPLPGIVAIGYVDNTIVFYVEESSDIRKVPTSYQGYHTMVKVTGRVRPL